MTEGSNTVNGDHLRQLIDRIERVEETIRGEQEARKEIYSECKSVGFDAKIVRKIVAARKKAADARREENELLSLYADAIGQGDLFA
jgi:uncharacterized protein (UPF0335 family)